MKQYGFIFGISTISLLGILNIIEPEKASIWINGHKKRINETTWQ